jgi:Uma2 family endonuclease
MATKTMLTLADYEALPEDGRDYELIEGELSEVSRPKRGHSRVQTRILLALGRFLEAHPFGEADAEAGFLLEREPATLAAPDVSFLSRERAETVAPDAWPEGAPEIAVEIVSPSEPASQLRRKVNLYLGAGSRLVWVVYPDLSEVHVFAADGSIRVLRPGDALTAEDVLPGFELPVASIFA